MGACGMPEDEYGTAIAMATGAKAKVFHGCGLDDGGLAGDEVHVWWRPEDEMNF